MRPQTEAEITDVDYFVVSRVLIKCEKQRPTGLKKIVKNRVNYRTRTTCLSLPLLPKKFTDMVKLKPDTNKLSTIFVSGDGTTNF